MKIFNIEELKKDFEFNLKTRYGKNIETANDKEKYQALSFAIMGLIREKWEKDIEENKKNKAASYFSAEFLVGRSLGNNLLNLGIEKDLRELFNNLNINLSQIEEVEEDAALGNGGLGRLAACFMESAASLDLALNGYGVRYREGLFKQYFEDGFQREEGDSWTGHDYAWTVRREDKKKLIEFTDQKVWAVPYDMPVIGYGSKRINRLRLWQAEAIKDFDFNSFNNFEYDKAVKEKTRAEDITRVLYPNDMQRAGKLLRLKQQYFFVSASILDLVDTYKIYHSDDSNFEKFSDYNIIQLNDTHPVIAIPELMRIFIDREGLSWTESWLIVKKVFAFTNHTVLKEAMEVWSEDLVASVNTRVLEIIKTIDQNYERELESFGLSFDKVEEMRICKDGLVHMVPLAISVATKINGVASLHTDILKTDTLKDYYKIYPERFTNKTNGVTPRRWLAYSNPELRDYITELLGNEDWICDLSKLEDLMKFVDDDSVLARLMEIKYKNKERLRDYILKEEEIEIDPNSIFDVQVKRLHEYKRQLLNALHIVDLYHRLKENPDLDIVPRTFIFGAKAAPGYFRAKGVIKFINEIARVVNSDPDVNKKLKVVFVQNFRVSYGEKIYPAADVSEQISTAGKEASGTGNMKFMMNLALTLGTYDGANIEIAKEAGEENCFIFGSRVEDLDKIRKTYNPNEYYYKEEDLRAAVDSLMTGEFKDNDSFMFLDIFNSLVSEHKREGLDAYFVLLDFKAYKEAQKRLDLEYRDKKNWARKCLINLAKSGKFSSDRTILEYSKEIWKI